MHPIFYQEFEKICSERNVRGSVLEVGAIPSERSLLCMKSLEHVAEKMGVNIDGPHEFMDFKIIKCNANSMDLFENERFDTVLCNAMVEHDKFFWKTISEIKRVTKTGGMIVIGSPGYTNYKFEKVKSYLKRCPVIKGLNSHKYFNFLFNSTITFQIHAAPGDYYRFSPQAFKEVLLDGLDDVELRVIMLPPRIIGLGFKSNDALR
ncbi:methyltransferase domain-containing protein [Desulfofustis limnaeus]|nr:methyltransferase domain-containing protein [Desulfofustis limnaeus]